MPRWPPCLLPILLSLAAGARAAVTEEETILLMEASSKPEETMVEEEASVQGLVGDLDTAASKLSASSPVSPAGTSGGATSTTTAATIVSTYWTNGSSFTTRSSNIMTTATSTSSTASSSTTTEKTVAADPVDPIAALLATVTVLDVTPFLPPGYIVTPRPGISSRPPLGFEAPRHVHSARRGKALGDEGRLSLVFTTTSTSPTTPLLPASATEASISPGSSSVPAWAWVVLVGGLAALAAALVLACLLAGRIRDKGGVRGSTAGKVRFLDTSMHQVRAGRPDRWPGPGASRRSRPRGEAWPAGRL